MPMQFDVSVLGPMSIAVWLAIQEILYHYYQAVINSDAEKMAEVSEEFENKLIFEGFDVSTKTEILNDVTIEAANTMPPNKTPDVDQDVTPTA